MEWCVVALIVIIKNYYFLLGQDLINSLKVQWCGLYTSFPYYLQKNHIVITFYMVFENILA